MTPPVQKPADPVTQAMQEVDYAQARYNSVGAEANQVALQDSEAAKNGDANAKARIEAAEKRRAEAQGNLKRAQSRLAKLTGSDDPHKKKVTVADRRPTPAQKEKLELQKGHGEVLKVFVPNAEIVRGVFMESRIVRTEERIVKEVEASLKKGGLNLFKKPKE